MTGTTYFHRPMPSPDEQRLLDLLHLGPVSNAKARRSLNWDDEHFEIVKADLVAQKLIIIGRGRGGTIRLAPKTN